MSKFGTHQPWKLVFCHFYLPSFPWFFPFFLNPPRFLVHFSNLGAFPHFPHINLWRSPNWNPWNFWENLQTFFQIFQMKFEFFPDQTADIAIENTVRDYQSELSGGCMRHSMVVDFRELNWDDWDFGPSTVWCVLLCRYFFIENLHI